MWASISVFWRQDLAPYEQVHRCAGDGREAHPDPEGQGHPDAELAQHEERAVARLEAHREKLVDVRPQERRAESDPQGRQDAAGRGDVGRVASAAIDARVLVNAPMVRAASSSGVPS